MSTVLIAAAGYIINDYFDVKTDKINRPDTIVIDRVIKRRWAMLWHVVFNVLGILLGIYVAYKAGTTKLAIIHVISVGLLWYYSTSFKKQLLVGNLIVSFLAAVTPLMVMLYDLPKVIEIYNVLLPDANLDFSMLYKYILAFSLFAFISSLIREIIKDMEDIDGDSQTGCETVPIKWGMRASKAIVIGLISNMILLLSFVVYKLYSPKENLPTLYIVIGIILPLLFLIYRVYKAQNAKDYHKASLLIKLIMLIGLCFSLLIFYLANYATR